MRTFAYSYTLAALCQRAEQVAWVVVQRCVKRFPCQWRHFLYSRVMRHEHLYFAYGLRFSAIGLAVWGSRSADRRARCPGFLQLNHSNCYGFYRPQSRILITVRPPGQL